MLHALLGTILSLPPTVLQAIYAETALRNKTPQNTTIPTKHKSFCTAVITLRVLFFPYLLAKNCIPEKFVE